MDEWQWDIQRMLLINLFLNDGRIVELDIFFQKPFHGIMEDAFDVLLLDIFGNQ